MTSSPAYVVVTPSVSLLDREEKGRGVTSFKPGAGRPGIEFQTKQVWGWGCYLASRGGGETVWDSATHMKSKQLALCLRFDSTLADKMILHLHAAAVALCCV